MWHLRFNLDFTKLRENSLCTEKTKIMTLFNNACHDACVSLLNKVNCFLCRVRKLSDFIKNIFFFKDNRRSYRFGTTWRWVINDRSFIFGWTIPLIILETHWNLDMADMYFVHERLFIRRIRNLHKISISSIWHDMLNHKIYLIF